MLPETCTGRAEEGIDDGHISQGVLKWDGHFCVLLNGLRKEIALDGVLIASGKLLTACVAPTQSGAVVNKNARWFAGWDVIGNFDLYPAVCAENLHALGRNQLRAAGEGSLSGGEVHKCGSEAVRPHIRIAVDNGDHAGGLAAEEKAGHRDGIAADIHERSAADLAYVADILRIVVEVAEVARNGSKFTDSAAAHKVAGTQP